ncbi:hypothetical protein APA_781 [Pseudanabaena sp. lw0831]|nr:hypothetical protein APA_781 [Pseudanabaena sp. lw0831]
MFTIHSSSKLINLQRFALKLESINFFKIYCGFFDRKLL